MAASTEEKAEELMRLALDQNFHGAEPKYFYDAYGRTAEQCVKDHSWDGQENYVRIIEMELDKRTPAPQAHGFNHGLGAANK